MNEKWHWVAAAAVLAAVWVACPLLAKADADIGVSQISYTGSSTSSYGVSARVDIPWVEGLYGVGQYDITEVRFLGQGLGDIGLASVGLGYEVKVRKHFGVFVEGGYTHVANWGVNDEIQGEVVYTQLVDNHYRDFRPIPVGTMRDDFPFRIEQPYSQEGYETSYKLNGSVFGRVGVYVEPLNHVVVRASYRFLQLSEKYELWDEESRAAGGGWWQEKTNRDMSNWELYIGYQF